MKRILVFLFWICVGTASAQKDFERNFASMHLISPDQKTFALDEIKKNTASVFIFLLPDCPACQSYSLTLNQLNDQFKSYGVAFYGVFPGNYSTTGEMKDFQKNYRIRFLLLTDTEKKLVKSLGAKITPEVFVVNNAGKLCYRGRIDDWMYAVGKKKPVITTHELEDALNSVVHHQPLKVAETKAIGCIIE